MRVVIIVAATIAVTISSILTLQATTPVVMWSR